MFNSILSQARFLGPSLPALLALVCSYSAVVHGKDKDAVILRFSYGENEAAPYYYTDQDGQPLGVVFDIIRAALPDTEFQVQVVRVPRNRLSGMFKNHMVDIDLMHPDWLKEKLPVVFSVPLAPYNETIFIRQSDLRRWREPSDLKDRVICSHKGYVYNRFDSWVEQGLVQRNDSNSELLMLRMLLAGRCDGMISTTHLMSWLIVKEDVKDKVATTGIVETFPGVPLMFHQSLAGLLEPINQYLGSEDYPEQLRQITMSHVQKYINAKQ